MGEEKELTRAEKEAETQALLKRFLELGCQETFNKSFKELSSMSESAGVKLSNDEIASLILVGAGLSQPKKGPSK